MTTDKPLVLVVDDNEMNRDMLSRRLERQGCQTAVAEDGVAALEMVAAQPFDLVLLDIMMPRMNGYEVLEHLKADPQQRHIPVIMISAVDDLDSVVKCVELGADDYLFKPFNPILLKARIGSSLEKKRLRDQEQLFVKSAGKAAAPTLERAASGAAGDLPAAVARRVALGENPVVDHYPEATVLVAGVAGVPDEPVASIRLLGDVFSSFERLARERGIPRIRTLGHLFVAIGGILEAPDNQLAAIAGLALDMRQTAVRMGVGLQGGIHVGPLIGGVLHTNGAPSYDLWGPAMSIATSLQAQSTAGTLRITFASADTLRGQFILDGPTRVAITGTGTLDTYTLKGRAFS